MERELTLQPRLQAIAELVPACSCLADVGTDHGYIPVFLLLNGRITAAIASDIGAEPLAHAVRTAEKYGVSDRISFRCCDGLSGISQQETDTILIAGMGGDNIVSILEKAPWTKDGVHLLLQPMSRAEVLRAWLPENGYLVLAERLVSDKGVLYPILTVSGGRMKPATPAQAYGGFLLQGDALWGRYLADRILRLRRVSAGLEKARGGETLQERRRQVLEIIAELESWKGERERANSKGS